MKITFIRLNMFENISSDAMKPVLFGIIKNITPKKHQIDFIDERAEKLPEKIDSDIIAFSVETFTAKRAYILAKKYKTPKNIIVMGGFHACVMSDEMLNFADSVLIGDAEDTWNDFLEDCEKRTPLKKYFSKEKSTLYVLCLVNQVIPSVIVLSSVFATSSLIEVYYSVIIDNSSSIISSNDGGCSSSLASSDSTISSNTTSSSEFISSDFSDSSDTSLFSVSFTTS